MNPLKTLGLGINLYSQYRRVLKENPELRIYYNGKEIFHFKEVFVLDENDVRHLKPKEIYIDWHKPHPMSGYQGRTSWMRCSGTIKYIKGKYRVRCYMVEDSGPSKKYHKEFDTMEEALRYIIPDFQSLLSYYGEYK